MNQAVHQKSVTSRDARRIRYLKLIAVFKILKGVLLLVLGMSLLFLNARNSWTNAPLKWIGNEILMRHSRGVTYLLHKLEAILSGGTLHATAVLALFYAALFFTEGIGVYMQRRWAELLMIFECAALIPIEFHHLWHRPGVVGVVILLANCLIVWFLCVVLKRDRKNTQVAAE